MPEPSIRFWTPEDRPQLKALWQIAFGDSEDYIESYMAAFLRKDTCVVAEADGHVVSAIYLLNGISLFPFRKDVLSAGYTYSLATLPEYRGRGIGSAVYMAANDALLRASDTACILPAKASLYPFYEGLTGAKPVSHIREARILRDELDDIEPRMAARFPAGRYAGLREQLLSGMPHALLPEEFYEFLEENGTEFFLLENGLAAAENADGVCRILELLDSGEDYMRSVAAVARWCRADEYIVRTPLFFPGPGEARPFMLGTLNREPEHEIPADLWWGLGMD